MPLPRRLKGLTSTQTPPPLKHSLRGPRTLTRGSRTLQLQRSTARSVPLTTKEDRQNTTQHNASQRTPYSSPSVVFTHHSRTTPLSSPPTHLLLTHSSLSPLSYSPFSPLTHSSFTPLTPHSLLDHSPFSLSLQSSAHPTFIHHLSTHFPSLHSSSLTHLRTHAPTFLPPSTHPPLTHPHPPLTHTLHALTLHSTPTQIPPNPKPPTPINPFT